MIGYGATVTVNDRGITLFGRATSIVLDGVVGSPPEYTVKFIPAEYEQDVCNAFALDMSMTVKNVKLTAKRVIFNPPATVVLWEDGTKTVVKCDPKDTFDEMKGLALCYMKKALGNTSRELNKALRNR